MINAQRSFSIASFEAILLSLRPFERPCTFRNRGRHAVGRMQIRRRGGEKGAIENRYVLGRNPINGRGGGGGGSIFRDSMHAKRFRTLLFPTKKDAPRSTQYSISKFLDGRIGNRNRRNILLRETTDRPRVSGKTRGRARGIFNNVDLVTPQL